MYAIRSYYVIEPGTVSNDIISVMDWMPTIAAAAGIPDLKEQLLTGYTAGDKTFKVHLDGYNFLPYFNVITSYSIHYTKLYDPFFPRNAGFRSRSIAWWSFCQDRFLTLAWRSR